MRTTGMVRKLDNLGRIVIPIEMRRVLDIEVNDPMEVFVEDDEIILQKYEPKMACAVTGYVSDKNIRLLDGRLILSEIGMKILYDELGKLIK